MDPSRLNAKSDDVDSEPDEADYIARQERQGLMQADSPREVEPVQEEFG